MLSFLYINSPHSEKPGPPGMPMAICIPYVMLFKKGQKLNLDPARDFMEFQRAPRTFAAGKKFQKFQSLNVPGLTFGAF